MRADEPDRIGYVVPPKQPMTAVYPLRELGMGINQVWRVCQDRDLLPPLFRWAWMENRVRQLLLDDQFLIDNLEPWERASLFAWRSRSNCDRCFYARQYEHIGLYEYHPDRFEDACQLEERLCHRDEYSWAEGYRRRDLIAKASEIKEKRAKTVARYLRDKQQIQMFADDPLVDELAVTSCGLLCGK